MNTKKIKSICLLLAVSVSSLTACSSNDTSSDTSALKPRLRNAALDGDTQISIPCTADLVGPSGGKIIATADGTLYETAPTAFVPNKAAFSDFKSAVTAHVASFSLNGSTGWAVPSKDVVQANKNAVFANYGSGIYWTSSTSAMFSNEPVTIHPNGNEITYNDSTYRFLSGTTIRVVLFRNIGAAELCPAPVTTTTSTTSTTSTTTTVPPTTTSTVAPSTTVPFVPAQCTATSDCRLGDTGPGKGRVVLATEVRDETAVYTEYLEISPAKWDGAQDPWFGMASDARSKLTAYKGGQLTDWRQPTAAESRSICRRGTVLPYVGTEACLNGLGFGGVDYGNNVHYVYWTAESLSTRGQAHFDFKSGNSYNAGERSPRVRPVRSWRVRLVSLVAPTTEARASANATATTTTLWAPASSQRCANLSRCTVGEIGPGGGVILSANKQGGSAEYWEMAPNDWSSSTNDTRVSSAQAVATASAYRGGGFTNWKLPTNLQIQEICRYAAGLNPTSNEACSENDRINTNFGDGKSTRRGEYYWTGSGSSQQTVEGRTDLVSGQNVSDKTGDWYVRPVRSFVYTPPTTTTSTLPLTCDRGGKCKVGDISPAGNLIISVQGSGNNISYTELAPRNWAPSLQVAGNLGDPDLIKSTGVTEIGKYRGARSSDWRLPSVEQMRAAFVFFKTPVFSSDCRDTGNTSRTITSELRDFQVNNTSYWVTDPQQPGRFVSFESASGAVYYDAHRYLTAWGYKTDSSLVKRGVRPVRTVEYTGPAMTVSTYKWSPAKCETTSPPTTTATTLPATCQQRGLCRVGEVGPHGGIIITVNQWVKDGPQYTEMAVPTGARPDCQGTAIFDSCTRREWDNGTYSAPFGQYPTRQDLLSISRNLSLYSKLQLRNAYYWTNEYIGVNGLLKSDFTGGLSDVAQNLEIEEFAEALAVQVRSGKALRMSQAYFRGVVRWNCSKACVR